MVSEVGNSKSTEASQILQEIDSLLAHIAVLSEAEIPPGEFYPALLERSAFALSALGGELWLADGDGNLRRLHQVYVDHRDQPDADLLGWAEAGLHDVLAGRQGKIVGPHQHQGRSVVACPIVVGGRPWGILALWIAADVPQAAQRGYVKFGMAVAGMAGGFQERRAVAELAVLTESQVRFDRFCRSAYGAWSPREVSFQIANEGRVVLGCDRLSVAMVRGGRSRIMAVSGAAEIGRGNEQIAQLQRLIDAVTPTGQPFFYSDDSANLPPQVERELVAFLDESTARCVAVVPLIPPHESDRKGQPSQPVGAVVVEQFTRRPIEDMAPSLLSMSQHAAMALDRSLRIAQIPLLPPLLRRLRSAPLLRTWYRSKWAWAVVVCVGLLAALGILQTDLNVSVRGEVRPVHERFVFAPADGIVAELVAEHGEAVTAGAPLLTLRSTALDLESARIRGELMTAQQRLSAIEAERLRYDASGERADQATNRLSADELTLRKRIDNLHLEYKILEKQQTQLELTSPISGTVLTWDVEDLLRSRPVRKGQALVSVGDLDGPWMLELRVPDAQVGPIQTAIGRTNGPLDMEFILATQPNTVLPAKTRDVGMTTQIERPDDGPVVRLTADFDRRAIDDLRPGAGVVAKVHCGRASYLYVWLHGFYEEVCRRLF